MPKKESLRRTRMDAPQTIPTGDFDAVIFDLDGVVTDTAKTHAHAWKRTFDDYLKERAQGGEPFRPFHIREDYRRYVDGKPRSEGVRSFLESRGIEVPYGSPNDPPDRKTVCGIGNRKNRLFRESLKEEGVEVFDTTLRLISTLKSHGLKTAIVSSSRNCSAVLEAAGISDLFDVKVDGKDADEMDLEGKQWVANLYAHVHRVEHYLNGEETLPKA